MEQHTLHPHPGARKKRKRVGRGDSSGHGSFSTRGVKGQNSRTGGGVRVGFEGGQTPLMRRMPKLRGFKHPFHTAYQIVNVSDLNAFDEGTVVDKEALYLRKFISKKHLPVKILGDGTLEKKLTVKVDRVSESAKAKIEGAKGTVELSKSKVEKNDTVK